MKSLTEDCPKPMLSVQGKPMLAHVIAGIEAASVGNVLLIVGYKAEMVKDYFANHPPARAKVSYRLQEKQDGTGSAALLARNFVGDEAFLLGSGDVLLDPSNYRSMFALMDDAEAVMAVKRVPDPCQGAAVYLEGNRVIRIVEKPPKGTSTTEWINAGVYCFAPSIFDELDRIPLSPRGEYELTDAIQQLLRAGARLRCHVIEGFWRDIGRPEDLPAAEKLVSGQR